MNNAGIRVQIHATFEEKEDFFYAKERLLFDNNYKKNISCIELYKKRKKERYLQQNEWFIINHNSTKLLNTTLHKSYKRYN